MTRSRIAREVHRILILSALTAIPSLPLLAQEQNEAADTIVVTGSRITIPGVEAAVPTLAISAEELTAQGHQNFADIAAGLPQFAPAFGASREQSTFSGAATSGLNLANLRNLGAVRTLVLINGRRAPGGSSTSTTVDFNTIPTANIERIEVQTGGAAAVYGADAVAGVINIITKQKFEGIELGASYGSAARGDNENPDAYLLMGGAFGENGHGLLTIQYDNQGRVSCADRYLCAEDFSWNDPTEPPVRGPATYSGIGVNGRFFLADGSSFTRRGNSFTGADNALIPFQTAVDGYNRNATRDIAIPTERIMVAAEASTDVGAGVQAFAELNYGQAEVRARFEGQPFSSNSAGNLYGGSAENPGLEASIPIDNPFMPAALRAAALAVDPDTTEMTWSRRMAFNGRGATNNRQTIRAVAGLRGDLPSIGFGHDWRWELSHVYGRTSLDSTTGGLIGTDRLYHSLRVEADPNNPGQFRCIDAAARGLGCIPVNPFADFTKAETDYLSVSAGQHGVSKLQDTQAYVSGAALDLPAGPVGFVLGAERRSLSGFLDYDDVINRALVTGNQIGDTSPATVTAKEVFTEIDIPLLKDVSFARSLSLSSAFRHSDTSVGNYDTWKYGAEWAPIRDVKFRVTNARSVRAPVPEDLSGIAQNFGTIADPCTTSRRDANATRAANCAAAGIPDNYEPPLLVEQGVAGFSRGNPNLTPEQAKSLTYGVVWTPAFASGLALTVDRFVINIHDIITAIDRQAAVNSCYDAGLFCDQVSRGSSILVPGANYVLLGVDEALQNVARQSISGFDIEARYSFDLGDFGKLGTQLLWTKYDKAELQPTAQDEALDMLGQAGGSTSNQGWIKNQAVLNLNYRRGPIGATWHTRFIGSADMALGFEEFPRIPAHYYHDLRLDYAFGKDDASQVYLGVTNLLDKEPPFFAGGSSGTQALDTIPGYYDVFGRSYFGGVRMKF